MEEFKPGDLVISDRVGKKFVYLVCDIINKDQVPHMKDWEFILVRITGSHGMHPVICNVAEDATWVTKEGLEDYQFRKVGHLDIKL